jgi:hypothetical protein
LIALAKAPPLGDKLEDKGPFSGGNYLLAQLNIPAMHGIARLPLREVMRFGQDVRQLLGGSDADQLHNKFV